MAKQKAKKAPAVGAARRIRGELLADTIQTLGGLADPHLAVVAVLVQMFAEHDDAASEDNIRDMARAILGESAST